MAFERLKDLSDYITLAERTQFFHLVKEFVLLDIRGQGPAQFIARKLDTILGLSGFGIEFG